jgi:hypothetical protein
LAKTRLTKIEVAESHLKWAVKLFFLRSDPIVIETLVGAASGVLRGIAHARGVQPFVHDSDWIKPEYKGLWIKTLHKAQNFSKHADKDPDGVLEYETEMLHFMLLEACHLYRHLSSDMYLGYHQCKEALVYELWFAAAYPHLIKVPEELKTFMGSFDFADIDPDDFDAVVSVLNRS